MCVRNVAGRSRPISRSEQTVLHGEPTTTHCEQRHGFTPPAVGRQLRYWRLQKVFYRLVQDVHSAQLSLTVTKRGCLGISAREEWTLRDIYPEDSASLQKLASQWLPTSSPRWTSLPWTSPVAHWTPRRDPYLQHTGSRRVTLSYTLRAEPLWSPRGCACCHHSTPTLLVSEKIAGTSSSPWQSWSSDSFSYLLWITFLAAWRRRPM